MTEPLQIDEMRLGDRVRLAQREWRDSEFIVTGFSGAVFNEWPSKIIITQTFEVYPSEVVRSEENAS